MRLGARHTQTPSLWPTGPRRSLHMLPRFSSTLTPGCRELTIHLLSFLCAGHRAHGFVCTVSRVLTNEAYYPISWMRSLRLRGMLLCARARGKCRRLAPQPSLHSSVLPRLHLRLHEPSTRLPDVPQTSLALSCCLQWASSSSGLVFKGKADFLPRAVQVWLLPEAFPGQPLACAAPDLPPPQGQVFSPPASRTTHAL